MNYWVLAIGIAAILLEYLSARSDRYDTRRHMAEQGVMNGYSFMEHGGAWSNVFIVSPLVARILGTYHLAYFSWWSGLIFVLVSAFSFGFVKTFEKISWREPEAHAHFGKTTLTGWINVVFLEISLWVFAMFYLTPLSPRVSPHDLVWTSVWLIPFFFLGVAKMTRRWKFETGARRQVAISIAAVWAITAVRLIWHI